MRRLVAPLLVLGSLAVLATLPPAALGAVNADVSSNWAGYVVSPGFDGTSGSIPPFTDVSGTWVQPAARCGSVATTGPTASAFWVGLGGDSGSSNALEQIGTESDCTVGGTGHYWAWYELVPASSVRLAMKVDAGDRLTASVHVNGIKVTVRMANLTRGTSFSRILTMSAPDTSSAEWIAEAPSLCGSSYGGGCRQASLTNFGTVTFSHASATNADGHTGTISDPSWSATAVQLIGGDGGFGYRFSPVSGSAQAAPGALTAGGAGFAVKWSGTISSSTGGYGGYPGGGYPSGGGGYPYGGDPYRT